MKTNNTPSPTIIPDSTPSLTRIPNRTPILSFQGKSYRLQILILTPCLKRVQPKTPSLI